MKRERAWAFLQEFPELYSLPILKSETEEEFLEKASSLYYIKVKRLDEAILTKIHETWEMTGSLVDIFAGEEAYAYFPSEEGEGVWRKAKSSLDFKSNYAYTDPYYEEGENLLAVIDREGRSPSLVAVVEYGIETIDHCSRGEGITLYKIPKGMDIEGILARAYQAELEKVRAEADL